MKVKTNSLGKVVAVGVEMGGNSLSGVWEEVGTLDACKGRQPTVDRGTPNRRGRIPRRKWVPRTREGILELLNHTHHHQIIRTVKTQLGVSSKIQLKIHLRN